MGKVGLRYKTLQEALVTLQDAIEMYREASDAGADPGILRDHNRLVRTVRDSLIQRFEYCSDLFWKYLKDYLQEVHQLPPIASPRNVIRESARIGLLTEAQAITAIEMIESRNQSSHIYREEIAEIITDSNSCLLSINV